MRKILLVLFVALSMSGKAQTAPGMIVSNNGRDTAYMVPKHDYDSVRYALHDANYKLLRIGYYLNICISKPRNDKFLKGWIRRVLNK